MAVHKLPSPVHHTQMDKVLIFPYPQRTRDQLKGKRQYTDEYRWEKVSRAVDGHWAGGDAQMSANKEGHDYRDKWVDERFARLDDKLNHQTKLVEERLFAYGAKLDQFLGEMRDRDNQRHAESVSIQQTLASLQSSNRQVIMAIVLGFVSIAVAVLTGLLVPFFLG